ncbi:MAG: T9SS C-terminal target domain-containing protein [Tannerella sp.]|jgi:hypothetical protein|nr:T9SS C-terminal target domain-containing protein [Tannerella sp.]
MKPITTITALALCATALQAQQTNTRVPQAGDEIVIQQVEYKDPGRSGENVIWDFSRLQSVNDEYTVTYSAPALTGDSVYIMGADTLRKGTVNPGDLIIGTEHYTNYYYRLTGNRLQLLGHENATTLLRYEKPLPVADCNAKFGETATENYTATSVYSGEFKQKTSGEVSITEDARGMMIIPSGDTLRNVLRIKTVQTVAKLSGEGELAEEKDATVETYRWYVPGSRYPVFVTIRRDSIFETAFFYPQQDNYYVDNLANQQKTEETSGEWAGLQYNFYPNPLISPTLNIELYLPRTAQVRIQLLTQSGVVLLDENKGELAQGLNLLPVQLPALNTGYYVITVILNNSHRVSGLVFRK